MIEGPYIYTWELRTLTQEQFYPHNIVYISIEGMDESEATALLPDPPKGGRWWIVSDDSEYY